MFSIFEELGISVDVVATSEVNVFLDTVSIKAMEQRANSIGKCKHLYSFD